MRRFFKPIYKISIGKATINEVAVLMSFLWLSLFTLTSENLLFQLRFSKKYQNCLAAKFKSMNLYALSPKFNESSSFLIDIYQSKEAKRKFWSWTLYDSKTHFMANHFLKIEDQQNLNIVRTISQSHRRSFDFLLKQKCRSKC